MIKAIVVQQRSDLDYGDIITVTGYVCDKRDKVSAVVITPKGDFTTVPLGMLEAYSPPDER